MLLFSYNVKTQSLIIFFSFLRLQHLKQQCLSTRGLASSSMPTSPRQTLPLETLVHVEHTSAGKVLTPSF